MKVSFGPSTSRAIYITSHVALSARKPTCDAQPVSAMMWDSGSVGERAADLSRGRGWYRGTPGRTGRAGRSAGASSWRASLPASHSLIGLGAGGSARITRRFTPLPPISSAFEPPKGTCPYDCEAHQLYVEDTQWSRLCQMSLLKVCRTSCTERGRKSRIVHGSH